MTERRNVLYFEDNIDHAEAFFAAMKARARLEHRRWCIIWFKVGLKAPRSADFRQNRPYPATVRRVDRPMKVNIDADGVTRAYGKVEWWPREFDAAVLDVVHQASGGKVGHDFARWFAEAGFTGPVFMVSIQSITSTEFGLRNFRTVIKRDDEPWIDDLADGLSRWANGAAKVNYRGHPPQRLLADFFGQADLGPVSKTLAYFGPCAKLGDDLAEFFHMRRVRMGEPGVQEIHDALLRPRRRDYTVPSLIIVDCGREGCFTNELLYQIATAEDAITTAPIWLVLADSQEVTDRKTYASMNVAVVVRDDIVHRRSVWAYDTIVRLANTYEMFKQTYGKVSALPADQTKWNSVKSDAAADVLKALLAPYAMARSVERLVNGDLPLVTWIDPEMATVLNGTFAIVVRELARRGSPGQTKLFSR